MVGERTREALNYPRRCEGTSMHTPSGDGGEGVTWIGWTPRVFAIALAIPVRACTLDHTRNRGAANMFTAGAHRDKRVAVPRGGVQ